MKSCPPGGLTAKMQPREGASAAARRASRLAVMRLPRAGKRFESLIGFLDGADAAGLSHAELEEHLDVHGRELLRCLLDDHLALRAVREQRLEQVVGDEGKVRTRVEPGHVRALETVFGTVSVERLAYRAPGVGNLHPADAALNLPVERHSHGLRKLCALESPRGSFDGAIDAICRQTGVRLAKRQVEELAGLAAMDFEDFYESRRPARGKRGDLLVLSADGKGIVMRADALRTRAPARPRAGPAPKPRLSGEEQQNRKRMAEIGAVYDAKPAPRTPADILTSAQPEGYEPAPGPVARNKWLTASIVNAPAEVIKRIFDEAERRDPKHRRTWVALVDGANHQIERISFEARKREVKVTIVVDVVHVLGYLWQRSRLPSPQRRPGRRALGAPPGDQSAPRTRPQGRRHDPPPSHQRPPRPVTAQARRRSRHLPDQQSPLPRLPHRAHQRMADRDRNRRRRLPPSNQGPDGHHRRPLGTRRRRGDPQATRHHRQRRLRGVLAISTSPKNDTTSTKPATTTTPSQPHDTSPPVTSEEPHPRSSGVLAEDPEAASTGAVTGVALLKGPSGRAELTVNRL